MAVDARNLTNQKLYFAHVQLAKLKLLAANNSNYLERQACVESCVMQLFFAYRALVLEIADYYGLELSLPLVDLDTSNVFLAKLENALAIKNFSSPELIYLKQLASDKDSFLSVLFMRFAQSVNGGLSCESMGNGEHLATDFAVSKQKKIQLIEIKGKKDSVDDFSSELQLLYNELKDLVDELRDTLQEY